jgi:hypothetical protein
MSIHPRITEFGLQTCHLENHKSCTSKVKFLFKSARFWKQKNNFPKKLNLQNKKQDLQKGNLEK